MSIEFLHGSNLEIDWATRVKGRRIHLITSPPYNLGKPYQDGEIKIPDLEEEGKWLEKIRLLLDRFSKVDVHQASSCWLNCNTRLRDLLVGMFPIHQEVMWVSALTHPEDYEQGQEISEGRFSPVNSDAKFNRCHEWVLHLEIGGDYSIKEVDRYTPPLGVPYADRSNITRFKHGRETRCRGDVWFVPHETNTSRLHPCPFPPKLAEYCLIASRAKPGDLVVDPWCGIGSTAVAAKRLGLDFIGSDLSKEYLVKAIHRVRQLQA